MTECPRTAVLGAGVIGASWTALFLASGRDVAVFDPAPDMEGMVHAYVEKAWPTLLDLGLAVEGRRGKLTFHATAGEAAGEADFIQENVPERLDLKLKLFAKIERAVKPGAVVASSASGLTLGEMQAGWADPANFVLGHPFNPPHLIPLVEVMGNARTSTDALERAERFYRAVGKVTIRVKREVPGHIANRLQAALWREAIHLVKTGVASVEDVDKAVWAGPGLRWAAMGPTMLFHLAAGKGGLEAFLERYTDSFNRWWDDLGTLHLDPHLAAQLVEGVAAEAGEKPHAELCAIRDDLLVALLRATTRTRPG